MSIPPVRPLFQNGQRLTAERLGQAQEYLRDFIRRVCLAPLSAGVAGGFDLELEGGPAVEDTTLVIKPGMAIDGKGRLLIVPAEVRVPLATVLANAGIPTPYIDGQGARIAVQLDAPTGGGCGDQPPPCIVEAARIFFDREDFNETLPQFGASVTNPNCAEPWEDIADGDAPDPVACSITLGNLYYSAPRSIYVVTTFFRQGVEPRFSVLRNTRGQPAIFLTDLSVDTNNLQPLASPVAGVGVPVPALFTSVTAFAVAGGLILQATHVGPFGKGYAAGAYGAGDVANARVFVFGGGTAEPGGVERLPAGLAGGAAIPLELAGTGVVGPGAPLEFAPTSAPGSVVVRHATSPFSPLIPPYRLVGLSSGPSYPKDGKTVVPLAVSGIVRSRIVLGPSGATSAPFDTVYEGDPLTIDPTTPSRLASISGSSGGFQVLARATQRITNSGGTAIEVDVDVMVATPPTFVTLP